MNKIKLNEQQAKAVKKITSYTYRHKSTYVRDMEQITDLDLVTIARIVEGEPYEVGYEFKVDDVVYWNKANGIYPIIIVNDGDRCEEWYSNEQHIHISFVKLHSNEYTLISKAENREDLKGESE